MTSSIGVAATTGQKSIAADELIALADERLYKAKATGRNKVVSEAEIAKPVVTTKPAQ